MQPSLGESNSVDKAPTDISIASKPHSYKLIDIEDDNVDTELDDKYQETIKSVDNHVEKSIKHLSGVVSRMSLAIESLVLNLAITKSKSGTGGQHSPSKEVSKESSHDATVSHNMIFLHAPQPHSKLHASPWQTPSLSSPYQPLPRLPPPPPI